MNFLPLFSTFTIALLHTLIPSHWLCFVAVGKAQRWRLSKTLAVTAAAAALHVFSTVAIGIAIKLIGSRFLNEEHLEKASAGFLIAIGAVYLILHIIHGGHHHAKDATIPERVAILTLLLTVTISPCSGAIPVLLLAAQWKTVALIAVVLLLTTVGNMLMLVGLTSLGIEKLKFEFVERYEKALIGGVLCALGVLVLVVPH